MDIYVHQWEPFGLYSSEFLIQKLDANRLPTPRDLAKHPVKGGLPHRLKNSVVTKIELPRPT